MGVWRSRGKKFLIAYLVLELVSALVVWAGAGRFLHHGKPSLQDREKAARAYILAHPPK